MKERKTHRRSFLAGASLAAIATTAGCSVKFGEFEIEAGESNGNGGGQSQATAIEPSTRTPHTTPTRQPTQTQTQAPSNTPTQSRVPTDTPNHGTPDVANISIDDLRPPGSDPNLDPVIPESSLPDLPNVQPSETSNEVQDVPETAQQAPTSTETTTPEQLSFKIENVQLFVRRAADAVFNNPNTVEISGLVVVESVITGGQRAWATTAEQAVEIEEGNSVSVSTSPTFFQIYDGHPNEPQLAVAAKMWEVDKGTNKHDPLEFRYRRYTRRDIPRIVTRHGPAVTTTDIEIYLQYQIAPE